MKFQTIDHKTCVSYHVAESFFVLGILILRNLEAKQHVLELFVVHILFLRDQHLEVIQVVQVKLFVQFLKIMVLEFGQVQELQLLLILLVLVHQNLEHVLNLRREGPAPHAFEQNIQIHEDLLFILVVHQVKAVHDFLENLQHKRIEVGAFDQPDYSTSAT